MVIKISKFFAYTIFFLLALMYFIPKVSLYYFVEHEIKKYAIVIDNEKAVDNGFSLSLYNATINVKGIPSATIKEANFKQFIIYNTSTFKDIKLSSVAASMIPTDIDTINIKYSIFNPLYITADAIGGFGEAEVSFSLTDLALHLDLKPSKKMLSSHRATLRNLKKSKDGGYSYDKTIKL